MSESKLKWQLMDSTAAPISHATSDTRCIVVDDARRVASFARLVVFNRLSDSLLRQSVCLTRHGADQ